MKNSTILIILLALVGLYFFLNNKEKEDKAKFIPSDNVDWDCPIYETSSGDTICRYKYDSKGNLIELNGKLFVTTFEYDENNHLIKKIHVSNDQSSVCQYIYDSLGNLIVKHIEGGFHYDYTYQGNKCISHITGNYPNGNPIDEYYEGYFLDDKFTKDTLTIYYETLEDMQNGNDCGRVIKKYHPNGALLSEKYSDEDSIVYEFKDNSSIDKYNDNVTYYKYKN